MRRTARRPIVLWCAALLAPLALVYAAWAQSRDRFARLDLSPDLKLSVGLGCIVYLRVPPDGDSALTANAKGMGIDRKRPVLIEGTLTGVGEDAITLRTDDRVYWINLDQVGVVEFQAK